PAVAPVHTPYYGSVMPKRSIIPIRVSSADRAVLKADDATRRWTHFLPAPPSVRETTCAAMYRRTLDAL
ncbi:MAG TPA: hypothetical protein VFP50_00980, partial [Anaeromyxobacteraceae bacterium]|nr:hypothetical protein [Anaeromyxobacteraceae bacterium]